MNLIEGIRNDILLEYFIAVTNKVKVNQNSELDLNDSIFLSKGYIINPMTAYLNINGLENKIESLRDTCENYTIHFLCIDETELYLLFPFK